MGPPGVSLGKFREIEIALRVADHAEIPHHRQGAAIVAVGERDNLGEAEVVEAEASQARAASVA